MFCFFFPRLNANAKGSLMWYLLHALTPLQKEMANLARNSRDHPLGGHGKPSQRGSCAFGAP